jgi:hypothetical protein
MRLLLLAAAAVLVLLVGLPIALGVVDDLGMLVGTFGWWGLAVFLVPTALILLFGQDDRPDRRH